MKTDTSPDVQKRYDDLIRQMTPAQRFSQGVKMIHAARKMKMAWLKSQHPEENEAQILHRIGLEEYDSLS